MGDEGARPGRRGGISSDTSRTTAALVATRTHTHHFLRARLTSVERRRQSKEKPEVAAMATATTPGTWAVAPKPLARSTLRAGGA